jgi:hypothetical protein
MGEPHHHPKSFLPVSDPTRAAAPLLPHPIQYCPFSRHQLFLFKIASRNSENLSQGVHQPWCTGTTISWPVEDVVKTWESGFKPVGTSMAWGLVLEFTCFPNPADSRKPGTNKEETRGHAPNSPADPHEAGATVTTLAAPLGTRRAELCTGLWAAEVAARIPKGTTPAAVLAQPHPAAHRSEGQADPAADVDFSPGLHRRPRPPPLLPSRGAAARRRPKSHHVPSSQHRPQAPVLK